MPVRGECSNDSVPFHCSPVLMLLGRIIFGVRAENLAGLVLAIGDPDLSI